MRFPLNLTGLPPLALDCITESMKPKFQGYFEFTRDTRRSIPRWDADGKAFFEYPNASMISDITVLWALLNEMYEAIRESSGEDADQAVASLFTSNPGLDLPFLNILKNGEYWRTDTLQQPSFRRVPDSEIATRLPEIWRTLRNGFSHFHWRYNNIDAQRYWADQQWDTSSAEPAFDLPNRTANNYTAYIIDAKLPWNSSAFWSMKDLRIIVMKYDTFRYWIFVFLNLLLNDDGKGPFGHDEVRTS